MPNTVFIVEDDQDIAEILRFNLEHRGYEVLWKGNGEEAYESIKEKLPDLLILDISLPGISGLQICRYLRSNPKTQKLPIMILTARTKKEDREEGMRAGADDYITKPFNLNDVMKRVDALIKLSA
ncbi:MAG: response regulator [Calditrichaceae bacterium]|jgi:DNA-binding response OmpR family regulator